MRRRGPARWIGILWLVVWAVAPTTAQVSAPGSVHRVFMKDGEALPSYGEAAFVGDRVVFNLSIGTLGGRHELQLVSLPVPLVDVERTTRYAESVRAAFFATARGEAAFASLTAALSHDLQALTAVDDKARQLLLAEELRQRLVAWPRAHFYYRVEDVDRLVGLVDDVMNELKVTMGARTFSFELRAGPFVPVREALVPAPGLSESIELALRAAAAADLGEDRLGILRAAARVVTSDDVALQAAVSRRLTEETAASRRYAALGVDVRARMRAAEAAGDDAAVDRLEAELVRRDQQLGFRRPHDVQVLLGELGAAREAARVRRDALRRYASMRRELLAYERAVRPALAAIDGLRSILEQVRDRRMVPFDRLVRSGVRIGRLQEDVASLSAPDDVRGVHATIASALNLAREACARTEQAAVTNRAQTLGEASSAAAGALLLADRARRDLVDVLCLGGRVATCAASPR